MSIESLTKIENYTGITKSRKEIDKLLSEIKENSKKAKYNYESGMVCGLLLRDFSILMTLKKDTPKETFKTIIGEVKQLIETYNWKKDNVYDLLSQCFSDDG